MRTRTLLLLALACGLAILTAGVFLFLGLAGQEAAPAHEIGTRARAGDLAVLVERVSERAGTVDVVVELAGVDDPDAAGDFRLVVANQVVPPGGTAPGEGPAPCTGSTVAPAECTLTFALPDDAGSARVLVLRRGTEQVRWNLHASS